MIWKKKTLEKHMSQFVYYSTALDKSTELSCTTQLVVFICGIDVNFVVTEETAALVSMKDSTRGCDLLESFNAIINWYNLKLSNLAGISTDNGVSMIGENEGLVGIIKRNNPDVSFVQYHNECSTSLTELCTKHSFSRAFYFI